MADRTLTINHADGGSETYTINRDKFAGVREMSRGHVYPSSQFQSSGNTAYWSATSEAGTDGTGWDLVSDLGNDGANYFGSLTLATNYTTSKVRVGKHRAEFDLTLNSGVIDNGASNINDRPLVLVTRDYDDDQTTTAHSSLYEVVEGFNSIDVEVFDDGVEIPHLNFAPSIFLSARPSSVFDVTISNLKVTHEPDAVTVDHTAVPKHQSKETTLGGSQSITIKRDIEPLLSKVVGGAAAAYSLRDLHDTTGVNKVVRVRRESDNNERDFNAKEVSNGTLQNWTNAQVTPPLDLRELTATGRDGDLIEAAAAYSLRNLSDSYAGDVVEVRRNTDGALKDFKASEITDGTLEAWVNTSFANALPLDTSGAAAAAYSLRNLGTNQWSYGGDTDKLDLQPGNLDAFITNETATGFDFSVNSEGSNKFKNLLPSVTTLAGNYTITLDVELNSGNLTGCILYHTDGSGVVTPLTTGANSLNLTSDAAEGIFFYILGTAVADVSITNITLTQTLGDSNYLPAGKYVTQVRRSSDDAVRSFTAAEVTDGTLVTWVGAGNDGTVSKWYDQSGNDNHATQGTPASQPKIVSGGSLVTGGLDFDGVDDNLDCPNTLSQDGQADATIFVGKLVDNLATYGFCDNSGADPHFIRGTATDFGAYLNFSTDMAYATVNTDENLHFVQKATTSTQSFGSLNGVTGSFNAGTNGYTGGVIIGSSRLPSAFLKGSIKEFIIYASDQSDKRRAIEENIGSTYGITLTSSKDGTVSKWYDQSTTSGVPNAKHAVQTSAARQPKIVSGGSLVTGGLDFDGVDDTLVTASTVLGDTFTSAMVVRSNSIAASGTLLSQHQNAAPNRLSFGASVSAPYDYRFFKEGSLPSFFDTTTDISSSDQLSFVVKAGVAVGMYIDGGTNEGGNLGSSVVLGALLAIGAADEGAVGYGSFRASELILYNSDQTDNRTALEANIGEVYGIAGIPAYDNTVNGFVETWYDQSGNGNNATQLTAGSQPKIVDAGVLVSGGLDFDGSSSAMDIDGLALESTEYYMTAVIDLDTVPSNSLKTIFDSTDASNAGAALAYANASSQLTPFMFDGDDASVNVFGGGANLTTSKTLVGCQFKSGASESYINGGVNSTLSNTWTSAGTNTFTKSTIGYDQTTPGRSMNGKLAELLVYESDQTANRLAIEANINNQYEIY